MSKRRDIERDYEHVNDILAAAHTTPGNPTSMKSTIERIDRERSAAVGRIIIRIESVCRAATAVILACEDYTPRGGGSDEGLQDLLDELAYCVDDFGGDYR